MVVLKEAEEEDKDVTSPMEASWLSLPSLQLESWTVGKDYASWAANILILLIKDFFGEHPFRKLIPIIEKWPQVAQQLLPAVFAAVLEKDMKMSWSSPGTFQIEELSEEKLSKPLGWEAEVGVVATALPLPDYLEAELSAIASKLSENSPVTKNKPLFKMPDEVPVFSVLPVHLQLASCMNSVLRTTLQEKHSSARKQACKIIVHSLSYLRQVKPCAFSHRQQLLNLRHSRCDGTFSCRFLLARAPHFIRCFQMPHHAQSFLMPCVWWYQLITPWFLLYANCFGFPALHDFTTICAKWQKDCYHCSTTLVLLLRPPVLKANSFTLASHTIADSSHCLPHPWRVLTRVPEVPQLCQVCLSGPNSQRIFHPLRHGESRFELYH